LLSSAIATDNEGTKTLIFSELYTPAKSRLLKISKSSGNSEWTQPVIFSDYGVENLGASIVLDPTNELWVFWSANKGSQDDIVYKRTAGQRWSETRLVHEKNEVPDFQPRAVLTKEGDINVVWRKYDLSTRQYIQTNRLFSLDMNSQSVYKNRFGEQQEMRTQDIQLPSHVSKKNRVIIHFPNNLLVQSVYLHRGK